MSENAPTKRALWYHVQMQKTANILEFLGEPHFPAPCQCSADAVVWKVYYYCTTSGFAAAAAPPSGGTAPAATLEESTGGEGGGTVVILTARERTEVGGLGPRGDPPASAPQARKILVLWHFSCMRTLAREGFCVELGGRPDPPSSGRGAKIPKSAPQTTYSAPFPEKSDFRL